MQIIRRLAAVLLVCASITSLAQTSLTKPAPKKPVKPAAQDAAVAPATTPLPAASVPSPQPPPVPPPAPTGPTGIGDLKIGMTKAEVEALPLSASVRTNSPFTVKAPSPGSTVRPGEVKYETSVQMPGSNNPLQTFLLFKDDRLTEIFVSLDTEALLDALRKQVSDKYGASVREDSRKEEDCIYRNGNSFKLKSGALHDRWHTAMPGAADSKIQTALGDFLVNICPASLRDGLNPIQVRSVSIRVISTTPAEPKANLF